MVKIEENFLDTNLFKNIQELFLSKQIPWMYGDILMEHELDSNTSYLDNYQFGHMLYTYDQPVSNHFQQIIPILNSINLSSVCKIKVNMNPRTSKIVKHGFHVDVPFKCKTSILYLNTNDGFTLFEDGTKVESVMNRFVTFPHTLKHAGTTCTNAPFRMVINFNYVTGNIKE